MTRCVYFVQISQSLHIFVFTPPYYSVEPLQNIHISVASGNTNHVGTFQFLNAGHYDTNRMHLLQLVVICESIRKGIFICKLSHNWI